MKKQLLLSLLFCLAISTEQAQTYQPGSYAPTWESLDKRPVPQWYKDAKFGIFIHWGVYAVPGFRNKGDYAEWYQFLLNRGDSVMVNYNRTKFGNLTYYQLADQFKAELYNPDEWAQLIEKSGAKYVVLTSKHHDGFALWPSKEASRDFGFPWNAMEAGPHRDLLGDLFKALRKTSVHPGIYYSLYEWYNPLWLKDHAQYVAQHEWPQMKDVINTYQPEVFWTDGEWDETAETWKSREFLTWMYNESPVKDKVVTYDRWGSGVRFKHGGVYTPEYQPDANFDDHYWEESRGMGFSYGYNRNEDSWDYNSARALILQLIDKVSGGGNFLLDIGPDEHGKIPPIMEERLLQIGDWMKVNQEAVYNTVRWRTASQWGEGRRDYKPSSSSGDLLLKLTVDPDPGYAVKECFFTYNPTENNLYAILPQWPDNSFLVKDLTLAPGTEVTLLDTQRPLEWSQQGKDLLIKFPAFDPKKIKSQYAYTIKFHQFGAFTGNPKVELSYPGKSLKPLVTITAKEGTVAHYTLDGSVPDENSPVYSKPFLANQSGSVLTRAFAPGKLPSNSINTPVTVYTFSPAAKATSLQKGLQLSVYEGQIALAANLDSLRPLRDTLSYGPSLKDLSRKINAGLRYKGYFRAPEEGLYTFYLTADDGALLWIDGELLIDNDGHHSDMEKSGKIALKKGPHLFKLAYIQGESEKALALRYSVNGGNIQAVPAASWQQK